MLLISKPFFDFVSENLKTSFEWLIPQAAIARLEALENDNGAIEVVDMNDDEEASLDEDDDLGE